MANQVGPENLNPPGISNDDGCSNVLFDGAVFSSLDGVTVASSFFVHNVELTGASETASEDRNRHFERPG